MSNRIGSSRPAPSTLKAEPSSPQTPVAPAATPKVTQPGVETTEKSKVSLTGQAATVAPVSTGDVFGTKGARAFGTIGSLHVAAGDASKAIEALRASSPSGAVAVRLSVNGALGPALAAVRPSLKAGDAVVVTGQLELRDALARGKELAAAGISFVEASQLSGPGGRWMVGGSDADIKALTADLNATLGTNWARGGNAGAGTLLRVAHDAGARAMMQAYLEGFELLSKKTELGLDLDQLAEMWRHGSVVRADLLDAVAKAMSPGSSVRELDGMLSALGSAAPAVAEGIRLGVNLPAIASTEALDAALGRRANGGKLPEVGAPREVGMRGEVPADAIRSMGMIGLGRMGANIVRRLGEKGQVTPTAFDLSEDSIAALEKEGFTGARTLEALVANVRAKDPQGRATLWLSVPHAAVDSALADLRPFLKKGDVVIDGGNSNWKETLHRAESLKEAGVTFVDAGTSGGIWGLKNGYSLMVGGSEETVQKLRPIFESLAPGPKLGWGRAGETGAGHAAKMVHNGIEYGTMEAIAESIELVERANAEHGLGVNTAEIMTQWRSGTAVGSWLLDLTAEGLNENPTLDGIGAVVEDNGEGRWTALDALEAGVAMPVLNAALNRRFASQNVRQPAELQSLTERILAVMRSKFGGHRILPPTT